MYSAGLDPDVVDPVTLHSAYLLVKPGERADDDVASCLVGLGDTRDEAMVCAIERAVVMRWDEYGPDALRIWALSCFNEHPELLDPAGTLDELVVAGLILAGNAAEADLEASRRAG